MTYLLDTSAVLAHHLAESGAERVQAMFDDEANVISICVLTLLEFQSRLRDMGLNESERGVEVQKYTVLCDELVTVDDVVCQKAAELKFSAGARIPNIDAIIAASAVLRGSQLVHRDAHFLSISSALLSQQMLPPK